MTVPPKSSYSSPNSRQPMFCDDMSTNLESAFGRMAICPPIKPIGKTNPRVERRNDAYIAAKEVEHEHPPPFSMRKYMIAIYKTDDHSASATISPPSELESTQGASGTLQSFVQSTHFHAIMELELLFHDPTNLAACNDAAFLRHVRSSSWTRCTCAVRLRKVTIHMCIPQYLAYPTHGLKCLVRQYCSNVKEATIPRTKRVKLSDLNVEASLVERLSEITIEG